jgi:hypothetical protein
VTRPISWLLLLFTLFALLWSRVNPPFEATDELRHYRFVRSIQVNRALPVQGQEPCRSQSHHPPLWYAVGALITAPLPQSASVCLNPPANPFWAYRFADPGVDNKSQFQHPLDLAPADRLAVQLLRAWNVLLGGVTVWATWQIGRLWAPRTPRVALTAATLVAFGPMFLYMSGAINNDIIAAATTTLLIWQTIAVARRPLTARSGGWIGLLYGLALLAKFNTLPVLAVVGLYTTWHAWQRRDGRGWLHFHAALAGMALLVAGWWFVRNQMLYGEPTGVRILTELWGVRSPTESWRLALHELDAAWSSLWGRFGFGQIPLPRPLYNGLYLLVGVGLIGRLRPGRPDPDRATSWLLIGTALTFFAVLFNYILISPAGAMGRFFFPGLPALALLVAAGWERLIGRHALPLLGGGMGLLAIFALFGVLAPAYNPPLRPPATPPAQVVSVPLPGVGTLTGYTVRGTPRPGGRLTLELDWAVGARPSADYLFFAHLTDAGGLVTQRDTFPATGRYRTSQWHPDSRWRDRLDLHLPTTAYPGAEAVLTIGFHDPAGGQRLLWQTADGPRDALQLTTLTIADGDDLPPAADFGDQLRLRAARYDTRTPAADGTLEVTLVWEVLRPVSADYELQLLWLDDGGNYRGSADRTPGTATWQAGARISTTHLFALADLPNPPGPGHHFLRVAVQNRADGQKLPVILPGGDRIGDYLELAGVRVLPLGDFMGGAAAPGSGR